VRLELVGTHFNDHILRIGHHLQVQSAPSQSS
jgi:hypothetical protein